MPTELLIESQMKEGEISAVQATNRKALVDSINGFIEFWHLDGSGGEVYLHVELSGEGLGCEGGVVDYKTEDDVPSHSVPCPCGNPKHWLIKYEEEG